MKSKICENYYRFGLVLHDNTSGEHSGNKCVMTHQVVNPKMLGCVFWVDSYQASSPSASELIKQYRDSLVRAGVPLTSGRK